MSGHRCGQVSAAIILLAACLQAVSVTASPGPGFEPVDGAAEQLQSRRYETADPERLLRASIAVLQDIRFLITESESAPGLLVAQAPWSVCRCLRTVTISLQQEAGREGSYLVRLTSAVPPTPGLWGLVRPAEDFDFHQQFFSHLDREMFKETRP